MMREKCCNYAQLGKSVSGFLVNENGGDGSSLLNLEAWNYLTHAGIWRLPIPKIHGGYGQGWKNFIFALQEFTSTYLEPDFLQALITQASILYLVLNHGTDSQKSFYLPRFMDGKRACFAISDSGNEYDPSTIQTLVVPTADQKYFLSGTKRNVMHATSADYFVITCCNSSDVNPKSLSIFIIEKNLICFEAVHTSYFNKNSTYTDISFNNIRVGHENRLGLEEEGLNLIQEILNTQRSLFSLLGLAFGEQCFKEYKKNCQSDFVSKHFTGIEKQLIDARITLKNYEQLFYGSFEN